MSDHFEQAMQDIAIRAAENGGPELKDILVALKATNDDLDENHEATLALLADHVRDDKERAATVADSLARWQKTQAAECAEKHRELFGRKPRRAGDPADSDYATAVNAVSSPPETRAEANTARQKFTREQIVANFWILVGLLCVSGVVNGLIDLLFRK